GVIDEVRATGAPFVNRIDNRTEDLQFVAPWPRRPEDPGGLLSIRRFVLDPILVRAAEQAGAEVRMATMVSELVREGGRVAGGRGMGDAFVQADRLAAAIESSVGGTDDELDRAMAKWARWRDREFAEHYWFATDFGRGGNLRAIQPEVARRAHARGTVGRIFDVQNHRASPTRELMPHVPAATLRAVGRNRGRRAAVIGEVAGLAAEDARRRWLNRFPAYADPSAAARDAGPTDVDEISADDAARAHPPAAA